MANHNGICFISKLLSFQNILLFVLIFIPILLQFCHILRMPRTFNILLLGLLGAFLHTVCNLFEKKKSKYVLHNYYDYSPPSKKKFAPCLCSFYLSTGCSPVLSKIDKSLYFYKCNKIYY